MNESYKEFLSRKSQIASMGGFAPVWMPDFLFPFQRSLVEWSIRKGRAAIFADCGLGKTPMQLVFAENVLRHTNKPVLILTPLAVASQTAREAAKFGIDAKVSRDGSVHKNITIANYDRIHYFRPDDFSGVVCDECPSCIKAEDGKLRDQVTEFLRTVQFRLLCTATAAPNDYVELGTGSEALGVMGQRDMITMFFKQETKKDYLGWGRTKYRMKGHAETPFWKWVCSWARACRRPSDLGFDDDGFILPSIVENERVVKSRTARPGFLYDIPAENLQEEQEERRRTITERCEAAAALLNGTDKPGVMWCHLNPEGDLLEKLITGSRQIKGNQDIDEREELYEAFSNGQLQKLILKPKIGAWGLNWQHCNHTVTFGSHSFEQRYQMIRRFWRFGQKNKVTVDTIFSEGEQRVSANLKRKEIACDKMFTSLVSHMNDAMKVDRSEYTKRVKAPSWISERPKKV